jgi:PadR family transcriptional regulator AphA
MLMSKENKSRYAVLGMLSLGPMSGYDLKKTIELSTSNFWHESYGQIYPMLKQLAEEGLTTSHTEKQEGRPERHVYSLTDKGWETLRHWLTEPAEYQLARNELLLKLFFGRQVQVPISAEHVQKHRTLQIQLLQHYDATEAYVKANFAETSHLPYWLMTLSYGRHIAQALLAWCDETLVALNKLTDAEYTTETHQMSSEER